LMQSADTCKTPIKTSDKLQSRFSSSKFLTINNNFSYSVDFLNKDDEEGRIQAISAISPAL
jgi:hypothetical protein